MSSVRITEFLTASQGTTTRAPFSKYDDRTTYARVLDDTCPLSSRLKAFQKREFRCLFGNKVDQFVQRYFPSWEKGCTKQLGLNVVKKLAPP